jgi:hypothetical protein
MRRQKASPPRNSIEEGQCELLRRRSAECDASGASRLVVATGSRASRPPDAAVTAAPNPARGSTRHGSITRTPALALLLDVNLATAGDTAALLLRGAA